MNIYLLSQDENRGYDTHDSMVVVAESSEQAKILRPYSSYVDGRIFMNNQDWCTGLHGTWASSPDNIQCTFIGKANIKHTEPEIVCTSFNGM